MMSRGEPSAASATITIVAAALMALGIVMVFSASATLDEPPPWTDVLHHPALRQAIFTGLALLVVLGVGQVPYSGWRMRGGSVWQPAVLILLTAAALCALVLIPGIGTMRNGARRWLSIGPASAGLGFQPSEVAKLAVVVFLAAYCASRGQLMRSFWRGLLPGLLAIAALVALVGKEDFGTAALLAAAGGALLLAGGARWWHLAACALPGALGMAWLVVSEPYRLQRILGFRDIWSDPLGRGYHPVQSLLTIASGGWWGQGLGAGIQKYGYLPEARSDFIFAVICEELGLAGGLAVLGLLILLVWQGRRAMLNAADDFGRLLAFGAVWIVGLQAALNVAVVTVSVPTKGIALPLVSAGGSGVLILGALLGLLVNVARRRTAASTDAPSPWTPAA